MQPIIDAFEPQLSNAVQVLVTSSKTTPFFSYRTVSLRLLVAASLVALFVSIPILYIFIRALGGGADVWARLLQTRLLGLLANTLVLALAVTMGTSILGVGLAWLTERTDMPGRKIFRWLLALPLAIPAYIGAIVHLALLRPRGGYVPQFLEWLLGHPVYTPSPLGLLGASFILTLFLYPYVYLLSGAAFRSLHAALDEASHVFGRNNWQTLWGVTLPALRPGLTAGALLVTLDILAEYGTVALLRYETFSSAIFVQLAGRYDRSAASVLSGVLVLIAVIALWGELRVEGKARHTQLDSSWRLAPPIRLGAWRAPALALVSAVCFASLIVPVTVLAVWSIQAFSDPALLTSILRSGSRTLFDFSRNSLWSAGLAAFLAVVLSLPVALFARRHPGRLSRVISRLCQTGYALPGVVVALSLVLVVNRGLPFLYGTPFVVVIAYVLRHMPQAVRASEAALSQISGSMEEAARSLGRTSFETFFQVTLPLILPGLLAGGALVFLTSLKELPATLLLRPAGFDTLAVRVWIWAEQGFYIQAAPAAFLLIIISVIPLSFLLKREQIFR